MGLRTIILLAITTAFLTCDNSNAAVADSPTEALAFTDSHYSVPTNRLLRAHEKTGGNNEDRVGPENLANLLKPAMLGENNGVQALNILQLGDDLVSALKNAKLNTLQGFITKFNKKKPEKQITLIGTLSAHYGDEVVAKTLVNLQKDPNTPPNVATMARTLQEEQLSEWLTKDKSVLDVLNLLKLSDDGYENLFSQKLDVLEDYIKMFNQMKTGEETLLKTLTTSVGDESKLVSILAKAKTNKLTVEKASKLENQLVTKWRSENLQPEAVWELLNMGKKLEDAFSSGKLRVYSEFVADFNKNNPKRKVLLLGTLTAKYGEVAVAKRVVAAKNFEATKDIATKLQKEQLKGWMINKKSADDVFTLLKIKNDGINSIGSRKLDTLDEYIKLLNSRNLFEQANLVSVLSKGFGGEKNFALMVSIASLQPRSRMMEHSAPKYMELLFKDWLQRKLDPMSVFVQVLRVPEEKVPEVNRHATWIVDQYKLVYNGANIHAVSNIVNPRRF